MPYGGYCECCACYKVPFSMTPAAVDVMPAGWQLVEGSAQRVHRSGPGIDSLQILTTPCKILMTGYVPTRSMSLFFGAAQAGIVYRVYFDVDGSTPSGIYAEFSTVDGDRYLKVVGDTTRTFSTVLNPSIPTYRNWSPTRSSVCHYNNGQWYVSADAGFTSAIGGVLWEGPILNATIDEPSHRRLMIEVLAAPSPCYIDSIYAFGSDEDAYEPAACFEKRQDTGCWSRYLDLDISGIGPGTCGDCSASDGTVTLEDGVSGFGNLVFENSPGYLVTSNWRADSAVLQTACFGGGHYNLTASLTWNDAADESIFTVRLNDDSDDYAVYSRTISGRVTADDLVGLTLTPDDIIASAYSGSAACDFRTATVVVGEFQS